MELSTAERQVLSLIESDEDYARYFFQRPVTEKWFAILHRTGFFDTAKIRFDNDGNTQFWHVMGYLESMSVVPGKDTAIYRERVIALLNIIESMVVLSIQRTTDGQKPLNNEHIWWHCAKILNNIPGDIIVAHLVPGEDGDKTKFSFKRWLSEWLKQSPGASLVLHEVGDKLLGKFIDDPKMVPYAETIVEVITWIRFSDAEPDTFSIKSAGLACDPHYVQDAFEEHSQKIGELCRKETILDLAVKLKKALEFKNEQGYTMLQVSGRHWKVKVSRIRDQAGEFGFKENNYRCVVGHYSDEEVRGVEEKELIYKFHSTDPQQMLPAFEFEAKDKQTFVEGLRDGLPKDKEVEWRQAADLERKLGNIYEGLSEDFSQIWMRSLADGSDLIDYSAHTVLATALSEIMLARCAKEREDVRELLELFLSERFWFPIFRKLVYLCLGQHWRIAPYLFEKHLKETEWVLWGSNWEVELFDLLKNHGGEIPADIIRQHIDRVPETYLKEEGLAAYWRYKWLSPLAGSPTWTEEYNKAAKEAKREKPYEPRRKAIEGGFVGHSTPLTAVQIGEMPVVELVKYLNDFKESGRWDGTLKPLPDREGLAGALQTAVKANPKKFSDEITLFRGAPYLYRNALIRGFSEVFKSKQELDWGAIFQFCRDCLRAPGFLAEAMEAQGNDSGEGKYIWFVDAVMDLIYDACNEEGRELAPAHFTVVDEIMDAALPHLVGGKEITPHRDPVNYALNTALGQVIKTYIAFALRQKAAKVNLTNWGKDKYERFLAKGIEGYIWFGRFLPNIHYLDEGYVKEILTALKQLSTDNNDWRMFMEGYLGGSYVAPTIYPLMREHYKKAIDNNVLSDEADKRLVQHLAVAYLQENDALEPKSGDQPGLLRRMLDEARTPEKRSRWLELPTFFWQVAEDHPDKSRNYVLAFWRWTYEKRIDIEQKLGPEYPEFLSRLSELTLLLPAIGEEEEKWLLQVAPHIERGHRSIAFMRNLARFSDDDSVRRIGRIFREVLKHSTPLYMDHDIKTIVEQLYKLGKTDSNVKKDANAICNDYGRRGAHFLHELWKQNQ